MTQSQIIRIDPLPKTFSVTWMLGSRCNYECMYCPSELHDKTSRHHDLDTLKSMWHQVIDKTKHLGLDYKISFTGGEVTTNKNFLPFVEWIKQISPNTQFFLTTNGSASLNFYKRLAKSVNGISLSTHSEYINEAKFFTIALEINKIMTRPEKSLHVNIMDEYWNKDRILLYQEFCKKHGISHSVNYIDYSRQTRTEILRQGNYNLESI